MTHAARSRRPMLLGRITLAFMLALAVGCGGGGSSAGSGLFPPTALSYSSPHTYAVGTAIAPLNPAVTGTVASYSVAPALPAGLSINAQSGQITGAPTSPSLKSTYTVTAANSSGSTTFGLSIAVVTVSISPVTISRIVASGTPVVVALSVASVGFSGPIYSQASDTAGVFMPSVSVASNGAGYSFSLTIATTIDAGHYQGSVLLSLCSDTACTIRLALPSISVPFDIYVLSSTSAWPGNHLTALAAYPGVADWSMYQGNAAHTGYVPVSLDPNSFSTRWEGPTLNDAMAYGSSAETLATSGGQLYLPNGLVLYALKEFDATQVWEYDFSSLQFPSVNPPSVANDTVYEAAGQQSDATMYAFNAADGTLVFRAPMSSQFEHYLAPAIGPNGIYTNAGAYGGLYGFNFAGQQLFFDGSPQTSEWTPAVDSNYVYSYTGSLTLADPITGAVEVSIADPTFQNSTYAIGGSVVLGAPGSVFAANYANSFVNGGGIGNSLLDFDVNGQTISWSIPGDYPSTPAYNAGVVYAANNQPLQLEARAESTGALLWTWVPPQPGDSSLTSEVLLTDTMVFVSTNLAVYGIDLTTHDAVWSYPLAGRLALSQNGILYIQGVGPLTAINVK